MGASNTKSAHAPQQQQSHAAIPAFKHPVMLQGLAGSGKSSIQRHMQIPASRTLTVDDTFLTQPPVYGMYYYGNNVPSYGSEDKSGRWDYGGRGGVQPVWTLISQNTKAMVFVVDASDRASLQAPVGAEALAPLPNSYVADYDKKSPEEQHQILTALRARMSAKQLFTSLYATGHVGGRPLLVLATHQDQPGAMPPAELAELLGLPQLEEQDWRISGCNAETGEGLQEAFEWLNFVISAPTDFQPIRQMTWKAQLAQYHIASTIKKTSDALRDERLAAGWVLPAPSLLPGTSFAPKREDKNARLLAPQPQVLSAEDRAMIVLADLTLDPEDVAHDKLVEQAAQATKTIELTQSLLASFHTEEEDEEAESTPATPPPAEEASNASAEHSVDHQRQREPSEISATARTETSVHSNAGSEAESRTSDGVIFNETPLVQTKPLDAAAAQPTKSFTPSAPFSSFSSSFIVLPPAHTVSVTRQIWAKKHWYSRKTTLVNTEVLIDDIYKKNQWGGYGGGFM